MAVFCWTPLDERRFRIAAMGVAIVAAALAYANTFEGGFVWDDASSVLLHKHVQDPAKFFQLFREDQHAFGKGQGNFYRPLVATSFMGDYFFSRDGSGGIEESGKVPKIGTFLFHLTNLAWHCGAALLLFALLTRLEAPRGVRAAVPLIYVLHPLHTEAVAYISGRADMMSAVFMYAALAFALWDKNAAARTAGTVLCLLSFCCALASKESSFMFPFLLALAVALRPAPAENRAREYFRRSVPLAGALVILGAYVGLRTTILHFGDQSVPETTLAHRMFETCQSFALYIRLIFVPTGLHMERTLDQTPAWVAVVGAALLLACVVFAVAAFRRRQYRACFGMAWFLVTWFPISGLIPLNAPMAEHWLYVPLAGFLWALAEAAFALGKDRPHIRHAIAIATAASAILFLVQTVARNRDWRDNETIFRSTLAHNPDSPRVHYNLAVTYEDMDGNLPGARRHYESVLRLYAERKKSGHERGGSELFWDEELDSHLSLGRILLRQDQPIQAAEHFATLLRLQPDSQNNDYYVRAAAAGMGECCLVLGDKPRARQFFARAKAGLPGAGDGGAS